jgi:high-affinity iron transporter
MPRENQLMTKNLKYLFVLILLLGMTNSNVKAEALPPAQVAETIRAALFAAQVNIPSDIQIAQDELNLAEAAYSDSFRANILGANPTADENIRAGFEKMRLALTQQSAVDFALGRSQVWTSILNGSYVIVEQAVRDNNIETAQNWLSVREFRTATRFSRPNADATLALQKISAQSITSEEALQFLRADLFDTYQARLNESLRDLESADQHNFPVRRAELAGLAAGYFQILASAYAEQRGTQALDETRRLFSDLESAALQGADIQPPLDSVRTALENFRAAPLSPAEQSRLAGQLLRYLTLVPVEYERGISNGQVTKSLEIQEAVTFHGAAQAIFDDLRDLLNARDAVNTEQASQLIETLGTYLESASTGSSVPEPEDVDETTQQLLDLLKTTMPEEWQRGGTAGDFDVIESMLDQMETAIRSDDYEAAESARLEAYAVLESGPEARLSIVAPQSKIIIEDLFWNGQSESKGLAYLIQQRAPLKEIKASRAVLDAELNHVEEILSVQNAPLAIMGNAGVIVFREGLEAVVILASLMGSMKTDKNRKYRKPMWWGTGLALIATAVTWVLAHGILTSLARYGEKLEAVVSLIAIGVLLLITNWFFHKTYWTGWIANFQSKKKQLLSGEAGLILGLVSLGFTSVYREGFETVLFLQALVLESGIGIVLAGVGIGFLATVLVGIVTFKLQARLPYMNMLIVTGILIGGVLLIMVGKTVHVLQVVGWMPTNLINGVTLPHWVGTWFGTYATWQGVVLQLFAAAFVIGSYYLAEGLRKQKIKSHGQHKEILAPND